MTLGKPLEVSGFLFPPVQNDNNLSASRGLDQLNSSSPFQLQAPVLSLQRKEKCPRQGQVKLGGLGGGGLQSAGRLYIPPSVVLHTLATSPILPLVAMIFHVSYFVDSWIY